METLSFSFLNETFEFMMNGKMHETLSFS